MSASTLQAPSLVGRSSGPAISSSRLGKGAVVLACCELLAYLPRLLEMATRLWDQPEHQYFPFVLLGSCVLAHQGLKQRKQFTPGKPLYAYLLFIVAIVILVA